MPDKKLIHEFSAPIPNDRSFGYLFTIIFSLGGAYAIFKSWSPAIVIGLFVTAFVLIITSLYSPKVLAPFNKAWFELGVILNKIVSPIVLGIIFFILITPIATFCKISGRDELKLRKQNVTSYWVDRNPAGPEAQSFKNQF